MAFPSLIPSNHPFPLTPLLSSSSPFLTLNPRFTLHCLPPLTIPPPNNDPHPPPPPTTTQLKKKKKRKLKPNFYHQTLDHWSVKSPSNRSTFPWQQEAAPPLTPVTGISITQSLATHGAKPIMVNTQLGSIPETQFVVEKVDGYTDPATTQLGADLVSSRFGDDEERVDSEEKHVYTSSNALARPGRGRRLVAPWVHGAGRRVEKTPALTGSNELGEENGAGGGLLDEKVRISASSSTLRKVKEARKGINDANDETVTEPDAETADSIMIDKLRSSWGQENTNADDGYSFGESDDEDVTDLGCDVAKLEGMVRFPWEKESDSGGGEVVRRKSKTEVAEKSIPEDELRRLRNVSLRMKERMKVGPAGVTEALVERIHEKWKVDEVIKLKFEGPPSLNMKRMHKALEIKTGGLVIWRSGSSLVLYRGMTYKLPCVQSYSEHANTDSSSKNVPPPNGSTVQIVGSKMDGLDRGTKSSHDSATSLQFADSADFDNLLDQLGPRFKDWSGRNPLPVDADLLPGVVAGYKPPLRLLPYKTRSRLIDKEMTSLRRLARTLPPHFALGRNRQHQGLAKAMLMLWERSAIAKIAIKRGVPNTSNEIMAEEIKNLTGGILLSRNKEYIVFYRGNDFLKPSIKKLLVEKENLATMKQDEEEVARLRASALIVSNPKTSEEPLVAGTLAETLEANTRWANKPSNEEREKMKRKLELSRHASVVRYLERKLGFAQAKIWKAEKALAKVQEFLQPAQNPTDLEAVTDEERFLFRKIGLKMRAFLRLGIREVFAGTIQNMHLNWKHRELVKIFVKGRNFFEVKQLAVSLEAESGGVLISLDKTTKGYAIIMYRGKNYQQPLSLRPKTLLSRRQALARSIELQRREALNHHISNLRERIQLMKSQLHQMEADRKTGNKGFNVHIDDALLSDDDVMDEGEEAYLETYSSSDDDDYVLIFKPSESVPRKRDGLLPSKRDLL